MLIKFPTFPFSKDCVRCIHLQCMVMLISKLNVSLIKKIVQHISIFLCVLLSRQLQRYLCQKGKYWRCMYSSVFFLLRFQSLRNYAKLRPYSIFHKRRLLYYWTRMWISSQVVQGILNWSFKMLFLGVFVFLTLIQDF